MIFSIVLPFYNSSKTIYRAVYSILSQSFKDFELIIINDGSKDDSEQILESNFLIDHRVKYFKDKNKGVSYSRNFGISKAKFDYILFIDSDDYVHENYLEELYNDLKNNKERFIIQGFKRVGNDEKLISTNKFNKEVLQNNDILSQDLLMYLTPFCKIFERELIEKFNIKFREDLTYGEDNIFTLEYMSCSAKEIYLSDIENYYYVLFSGSLSSRLLMPDKYLKPFKVIDTILLNNFNLDILKFNSLILANKYSSFLNMFVNSIFIYEVDFETYYSQLNSREKNILFHLADYSSPFRRVITFLIKIKQYKIARFISKLILKKHFVK